MSDDFAAHNQMSSAPASDTDRTSASGQTESAGDVRDDLEWVEQMQMCARELVHLLHRMPVSSRKKQTAIQLLVKVIRLVTPDELRSASTGNRASDLAAPTRMDASQMNANRVDPNVTGNGTASSGSSGGRTSEPSEGAPDAPDPRSGRYEASSRQPPVSHRRVVGL